VICACIAACPFSLTPFLYPRRPPLTLPPQPNAMGFLSRIAASAGTVAVVAGVVALDAATAASNITNPVHKILQSPGVVLKLAEGRQIKA